MRCTTSGTERAQSRTAAKRASSQLGVGDDVDGDREPERAGDLQRAQVLVEGDPLAVGLEGVLVEGLDPEEHVVEAEPLPAREQLLVLDQHVAAGLQVVLLADAPPLDLGRDRVAVLGVDEGHVVDDEHVGLADARQVLARRLRRALPVAAPVEGPRAAEGAVPGAAAGELDRGARVEHADEVLVPLAAEVARGQEAVEVVEQRGARSRPARGHHPGQGAELRIADGLQHPRSDDLALAAHDAVDRALRVLEELRRDEGGAVAAHEHEACRARFAFVSLARSITSGTFAR